MTRKTEYGIIKKKQKRKKEVLSMANVVKVTKKDRFNEIKAIVGEMGRDDLVAFCDHEIELLAKKGGKSDKPSKKQVENESIKAEILGFLGTVEKAKVGEITKVLGDKVTSAQQVSALVTQLKNEGKVARFTEKKDIFFAIVTE